MELAQKARGLGGSTHLWYQVGREVRRLRRSLAGPIGARVVTVIPTYARAGVVDGAVRSALEQTVVDHRVIVVDDGSGQLPRISHPRLTTVSLRRNLGVVGAVRNVGIRLSTSQFIAFLDDDNEWDSCHLEIALEALEAGADFVYTAVRRVRRDGSTVDELSVPYDRELLRERSFVDTNAIVVRRHRSTRYSWVPRARGATPAEDWEFAYRVGRRRRTVHVPIPTVRYLCHEGSYYRGEAVR